MILAVADLLRSAWKWKREQEKYAWDALEPN